MITLDKNQLEGLLKSKVNTGNYGEAIDLLCEQIEDVFTQKIKKRNEKYIFKGLINLADNVDKYLTGEDLKLFKVYYITVNEEEYPLYKIDVLTGIFNQLNG